MLICFYRKHKPPLVLMREAIRSVSPPAREKSSPPWHEVTRSTIHYSLGGRHKTSIVDIPFTDLISNGIEFYARPDVRDDMFAVYAKDREEAALSAPAPRPEPFSTAIRPRTFIRSTGDE